MVAGVSPAARLSRITCTGTRVPFMHGMPCIRAASIQMCSRQLMSVLIKSTLGYVGEPTPGSPDPTVPPMPSLPRGLYEELITEAWRRPRVTRLMPDVRPCRGTASPV